jgi:type VI secretion system protein ImpH
MASTRRQDSNLLTDILREPWAWDFFQAARHIECAHPHLARIGSSTTVKQDAVRFGQYLSLGFATSSLEQPQGPVAHGRPPRLQVRFTGLTGPNGPLPLTLSEFIRNRLLGINDPDMPRATFGEHGDHPAESSAPATRRDPVLADFLDLFHHRLISLFYRAWAVGQKTVDFDREEDRHFSEWIASTFGLGHQEFEGLDSIPRWQKLAFAGHLSNQTRHASGLQGLLTACFDTDVQMTCLVGHWVDIPVQERCHLGETRGSGTLGSTCVIGARFWDRQQKFTLSIGPLSYERFCQFQPEGRCHQQLHDWIAFYTRREFRWEAAIVLKSDEVPRLRLGKAGHLGRDAWLSSTGSFSHHPHDFRVRGGGFVAADNT